MPDFLTTRLEAARRRVEEATPYSPEWAAAIEDLVALEAAVESLLRRNGWRDDRRALVPVPG